MVLDLSKGIPKGRPSKKIPSAFQRPRLATVSGEDTPQRDWQWSLVMNLKVGDIIAERGVVVDAPQFDLEVNLVCVRAGCPESTEHFFSVSDQVWSFTEGE